MERINLIKINERLLPTTEIVIKSPRLDHFDFGFTVAVDLNFLKPTINVHNFYDEAIMSWKDVEKFEFKTMNIDKTFDSLIRK